MRWMSKLRNFGHIHTGVRTPTPFLGYGFLVLILIFLRLRLCLALLALLAVLGLHTQTPRRVHGDSSHAEAAEQTIESICYGRMNQNTLWEIHALRGGPSRESGGLYLAYRSFLNAFLNFTVNF